MTSQPEFVRGIAATWSADLNGTRYAREAFDRSRRLFDAGRLRIPLLWGHDFDREHGEVIDLRPTKEGLEITARLIGWPVEAANRPLGLSVGVAYTSADSERRADELVIRDGILREVSLGTLGEIANAGGGPAMLLDHQAIGLAVAVAAAGHAPLPEFCPHCAAGLLASVSRPALESFDQLAYCEHHRTTVMANCQAGRVIGWHFLAPATADQHAAMIEQRRGAAR